MNNGVALFVTEWGSVNASGDGAVNAGETLAWVDFMKKNSISNANWALNDKSEGSSALVSGASPNGGWASNQLTDSGTLMKDIVSHWSGNIVPPSCPTVTLPALIQAESFCNMSGVQLETTSDIDGGQNVGYIDSGDWMSYSVDVPTAGTYKVSYRVASVVGSGVLKLEQSGGATLFGSVNIPFTGGWQTWSTVSHNVNLAAGKQSISISAQAGGFNINWLKIEVTNITPPDNSITIQVEIS